MKCWWDFDWRDTMKDNKKKKSGFKNEKGDAKKPDVPSNWFYMLLFCKLNDAPFVTLNDAVPV